MAVSEKIINMAGGIFYVDIRRHRFPGKKTSEDAIEIVGARRLNGEAIDTTVRFPMDAFFEVLHLFSARVNRDYENALKRYHAFQQATGRQGQ
jgi:hypothetical protein